MREIFNLGKDETDYSQYGLSVKVSYRNGEPLQELNATTQSGGERAVATAVFMLALQELTPVPFRCVDEINQGMDNNNERRIFDLLLDCTTRSDASQFFLITPKVSIFRFIILYLLVPIALNFGTSFQGVRENGFRRTLFHFKCSVCKL